MKISNRNSAIHFLLDGAPVKCKAWAPEAVDFVSKEISDMRPLFQNKIQYVCKSFQEAAVKLIDKIGGLLQEESISQSGTLIIPHPDGVSETIFYNINSRGGEINKKWHLNGSLIAFVNNKHFQVPQLYSFHHFKDGLSTSRGTPEISEATDHSFEIRWLIGLIAFSNFCEVETKIALAGKRTLYKDEKYINETALPIEILDSTWFTTIVRSEGFSVGAETGGFFRWQRFGPGSSKRKIVWVAPFEKKGYTRRAGKLIHQDKGGS